MGLESQDKEKIAYENGVFLNEKQKAVKQKIMEDTLTAIFKNIEDNKDIFDVQSILDLITSVLVMLNRDVLVHMIKCFNLEADRKGIMKILFEQVRDQVNNTIKKGMM